MGEYWTEVIDDYLSGNSGEEQPTTETTETTETTTETTETTAETTETTTENPDRYYYSVSDLVKLTKYVLNQENSITAQESELYDLIRDGRIDVFDVIIMRDEILRK